MVVVPATFEVAASGQFRVGGELSTLIIDRQPLFLAALGSLLAGPPVSAQVTTCSKSDAGLEMIRGGGVDLVFCELRAEPVSGIDLARAVAAEGANTRVILLGDDEESGDMTVGLGAPAAGLFTKSAGVHEFLGGVQAVLAGHRVIGAGLMDLVLERLSQQKAAAAPRTELSPTELEILTLIGRAQSVPSIAASRGISKKTVRNHLARIYRKLELHGRTEAVLWAARMGL